jgi:hypothetical protein
MIILYLGGFVIVVLHLVEKTTEQMFRRLYFIIPHFRDLWGKFTGIMGPVRRILRLQAICQPIIGQSQATTQSIVARLNPRSVPQAFGEAQQGLLVSWEIVVKKLC